MAKDSDKIEYGPCNVSYDATELGYFKGGVEADYTVEWHDVIVDQMSAMVDSKVKSEAVMVTVPMAETTLDKLNPLIPQGTYTLDAGGVNKKIEVGGAQVSKTDFKELIVTPCSDNSGTDSADANEKITVYVAVPKIQFKKKYDREGVRVVPVEFHGVVDTTKDAGKNLFLLGDSTATA